MPNIDEIYDLLKRSKETLEAINYHCGKGLEVTNWHMNGQTEPFDTFIEENSTVTVNELDNAIKSLERVVKINNID